MSEYKTYQLENALKIINRRKIITKVKHFAEASDKYLSEATKAQHRAEMEALEVIIDLLMKELKKK